MGSTTQPLTFEHQGIVVMDLQAQISGGAWATKGKTCFFRVVESLEAEGRVSREQQGGFPGNRAEKPKGMCGDNPAPHHGLRDMTWALGCAWRAALASKSFSCSRCTTPEHCHRSTEYPELEGTDKDPQIPTPGCTGQPWESHECLRALPKGSLSSLRLGA